MYRVIFVIFVIVEPQNDIMILSGSAPDIHRLENTTQRSKRVHKNVIDQLNTHGDEEYVSRLRHVSRNSMHQKPAVPTTSSDPERQFQQPIGAGHCGDVAVEYHDMFPVTENSDTKL